MADTLVQTDVYTSQDGVGMWGPYWISETVGLIVHNDGGNDIGFSRTTNAGVDWTRTEIEVGTHRQCAAWFDQETPGDTGTKVHIIYADGASNEFNYVDVDVSDASVGTIIVIDSGVTVAGSNNENRCSITKARNGNLIAAFSTLLEIECYRSVNAGATWVDRADVFETATERDWCLLFPANVDDGDVAAFFWDQSANEIDVKMYDDSANTWTPTLILASMFADTSHMSMDGSVRHSDGLILGCAHSDKDTTTDDLRTWTVNPNSIASPTIDTSTANVMTNEAESAQCGMLINQQNDDVYICWLSGNPTWLATVDVVYKISTNDMAGWGSEQAYSEAAADDFRLCPAGRTVGNDGGFFQPAFYDDVAVDIYVNLVNDVAIVSADIVTPNVSDAASVTEDQTMNLKIQPQEFN